jgi:hypothetical protein
MRPREVLDLRSALLREGAFRLSRIFAIMVEVRLQTKRDIS